MQQDARKQNVGKMFVPEKTRATGDVNVPDTQRFF
jgi:hypothetical protein